MAIAPSHSDETVRYKSSAARAFSTYGVYVTSSRTVVIVGTHWMKLAILTSTAHQMPHESLEADHLIRGPKSVSKRLIKSNVSSGHCGVRDS